MTSDDNVKNDDRDRTPTIGALAFLLHSPFVIRHLALVTALVVAGDSDAQTENSYPMVMSLRPVAARIGHTTECEVSARYNLHGAYGVLVSGSGVTGEVVPHENKEGEKPPDKKPNVPKVKVRFTVAPDVLPGVRDFRIVTPQGASTVGQVVTTRDPIVVETGDNNTFANAQEISIPATVCGAIEATEDIDCFKFRVEAGVGLTFHVRSQRLEDRIHDLQEHVDPILTLRNAAGATVATCDNHFAGDPLLYCRFDHAGDYVLEIRDVRYKGNGDWVYAIEISDRPFVTQVQPAAVRPGTETSLTLVGYNLPSETAVVTLPADTPPGLTWLAPLVGGQPANPCGIFVSSPSVLEETSASGIAAQESHAAAGPESTTRPVGQPITLPVTISGRLDQPGDIDRYTFEARAGEMHSFEVIARRADSALDSILRIVNAQGSALVEVDDLSLHRIGSADSWLENWAAPSDGKYTIEIRDLHMRGGLEYTYALQVTRSQPYFMLETDTDKTLLAPGTASPLYVRVVRRNGFSGDVQLAVDGLPAGVTATCGRVPGTGQDGSIILRAASDAPVGAANIRVTGTATHQVKEGPPLALLATARPLQELYFPGGGRGHFPVEMHTVSVGDPMDIRSVKLSANAVTLAPGESQKIDILIDRSNGFKGNVTLDVLYQHLEQPYGNTLPVGVSLDISSSKTLLTGEETQGFITLKAAADAPAIEKQLVPVMAHVSVNFVMKMTFCAEPFFVTVIPPAKE